jgi:biopolymer transport protein ExbD
VPLVDVVFLLLVFFMLTEIGSEVTGELDLVLPPGPGFDPAARPEPAPELRVALERAPAGLVVSLDGRRLANLGELYIELVRRRADPARPRVVLDPGPGVTTQDVVGVYDVALEARLAEVVFAAEPDRS